MPIDPELRGDLDDTRRHFDVVAERLESRMQLISEGISSLSERLDRVEENLREEILRSQRELSAMIRFSYAELDRRIQALAPVQFGFFLFALRNRFRR